MHFLAHFYVRAPIPTPEYAFGLMVPDITPHFTKVYNSIIKRIHTKELENKLQSFHSGILAHYQDDKLFHNQPAFESCCAELVNALVANGLDRSQLRISVIAHLLVEMLLDRWLHQQNSSLTLDFYANLEQLNTQTVHLYARSMGLQHEMSISLNRRVWFLENRFLHQLHNSEQMTMGVGRLYARLTGRLITKNEQFRIIEAVNGFYAEPRLWQALLIR